MSAWQPADGDFTMAQCDTSEISELHTETTFHKALFFSKSSLMGRVSVTANNKKKEMLI